MSRLVLSLFPGIGLLDSQFEVEGFCVVRGPDRLWGGDVCSFHPPAGMCDGVISGPPCQDFSAMRRTAPTGNGVAMLGQFCRVVTEAEPKWFLCENVPQVPDLEIAGYDIQRIDVNQGWWSGVQRLRHIQFGRHVSIVNESQPLNIPRGNVTPGAEPAALACDNRPFAELCRLQGLPDGFELPGFTDKGRRQAVGNGVPLVMGRKLAQAVRMAVYGESGADEPLPVFETGRRSCVVCQRPVVGKRITCSDKCRKAKSRSFAGRVTTVAAAGSQADIRSVTVPGPARSRFENRRVTAAGTTTVGEVRSHVTGRSEDCDGPAGADVTRRLENRDTAAAGIVTSEVAITTASDAARAPSSMTVTATVTDAGASCSEVLTVIEDGAGLAEFLKDGRYPGGKGQAGHWQWIVDHLPPHSLYVEPFAGSGAVARRKVPALRTLLIEADPVTVDWWSNTGRHQVPGSTIVHGDGIEWLENYVNGLPPDAVVNCDPPYLNADQRFYNRPWSINTHARLLDAVVDAECKVLISGYASDLYFDLLQPRHGWRWSTREVQTRWGGLVTDYLWHNFDPVAERAAGTWENPGTNYRERERIKNKANRQARLFAAMPPEERSAVLMAVLSAAHANAVEKYDFADESGSKQSARRDAV